MLTHNNKYTNHSNETLFTSSDSNQQLRMETLNVDIDRNIINKRSTSSKQIYFKLCGKTRRLPNIRGLGGILLSQLLFFGGTFSYELMCFLIIKVDINMKGTGIMTYNAEKEKSFMRITVNMKESLKMDINMVKESSLGKMEATIQDSLKMGK